MKRMLISLLLLMGSVCMLMAQSKPLTPLMNIRGTLKAPYTWHAPAKVGHTEKEDMTFAKGTPCSMLYVNKLKAFEKGGTPYHVVFLMGEYQVPIPIGDVKHYFRPDSLGKEEVWQYATFEMVPYYEKKGTQDALRREQAVEANQYLQELEKAHLIYDDAAIEDYVQCLLLTLMPEKRLVGRDSGTPVVRILKSAAPDIMLLDNNVLLVSTGMLATLDTEDELLALLSREVAHLMLDHSIITVSKNIARAKRAAFWGAVADGVVAAAEIALYEHYDYYEPGLLFATNDLIQALVNENIYKRMGLDYSKEQEREADKVAAAYMQALGKDKSALTSALHKVFYYYQRERDTEALSSYGPYGTLGERLQKLGEAVPQPEDRVFLKRMMGVVSFEAAMQDYNKQYANARQLAMKNIRNELACSDDYLLVARSLMKQSNTPESNAECLLYLDKAEVVSKVENVNITKMKILLMLRAQKQMDAVDLVKKYEAQLDILSQQPHTEDDARWIAAERLWAEKLLEQLYTM